MCFYHNITTQKLKRQDACQRETTFDVAVEEAKHGNLTCAKLICTAFRDAGMLNEAEVLEEVIRQRWIANFIDEFGRYPVYE